MIFASNVTGERLLMVVGLVEGEDGILTLRYEQLRIRTFAACDALSAGCFNSVSQIPYSPDQFTIIDGAEA